MHKKESITFISAEFIPRAQKRKSIAICVKISPLELQVIDTMRGDVPLSTFLRNLALTEAGVTQKGGLI